MDIEDYNQLYGAITVIEARLYIDQCNIADYSRGKKDGREKFRRHLHKLAFPSGEDENTVNAETIARIFGSG